MSLRDEALEVTVGRLAEVLYEERRKRLRAHPRWREISAEAQRRGEPSLDTPYSSVEELQRADLRLEATPLATAALDCLLGWLRENQAAIVQHGGAVNVFASMRIKELPGLLSEADDGSQ